MTEQQLDKLRAKLGGEWYDTWWLAISDDLILFLSLLINGNQHFLILLTKDGWRCIHPNHQRN